MVFLTDCRKYVKYIFCNAVLGIQVTDSPVKATAADVARQFSHFADIALISPVIVTKNGRERNVLLSIDEYNRLLLRHRVAYRAEETPDEFMKEIDNLIEALPVDTK